MLPSFYRFLHKVKLLQPATICHYNLDIGVLLNWFAIFRSDRNEKFKLQFTDMYALNLVTAQMGKLYHKLKNKAMAKRPQSIEDFVSVGRWPAGGMQDLYDAVISELAWLKHVIDGGNNITRDVFNLFTQLLAASAYVGCVQGRIGAIQDLLLSQAKALFEDEYILAKDFKTSMQFGLQPVLSSNIFLKMLQIYLLYFRPRTKSSDFLFISFSKQKLRIGKLVTMFFKRKLHLHITTTGIRGIVESGSQALHTAGAISNTQRASILNVNGHSLATAHKFYIRSSRIEDVGNARAVFDQLLPSRDTAQEDAVMSQVKRAKLSRLLEPASEEESDVVPGSAHPHYGSPARRIPWSTEEINHVGKWCQSHQECTNVVANCLKAIRSDPSALALFHPLHIEDSGRLRYGLDAFNKRQLA
jgi:hypothetical protein